MCFQAAHSTSRELATIQYDCFLGDEYTQVSGRGKCVVKLENTDHIIQHFFMLSLLFFIQESAASDHSMLDLARNTVAHNP